MTTGVQAKNVSINNGDTRSSTSIIIQKFDNSNSKLPTIQLPKFNGNYENWLEFHDSFESFKIAT